jgi:hypothetical protein
VARGDVLAISLIRGDDMLEFAHALLQITKGRVGSLGRAQKAQRDQFSLSPLLRDCWGRRAVARSGRDGALGKSLICETAKRFPLIDRATMRLASA